MTTNAKVNIEENKFCIPKIQITNKSIQLSIVFIMGILLVMALIIDGDFGERVFGTLMTSFGFVIGYFFCKAQTDKIKS